ncbi:hypothetical protein PM082_007066 [Marasmius tenuissimus]|nr:hypothetical protein PM082_007066 [Marasmius tenuissimus]
MSTPQSKNPQHKPPPAQPSPSNASTSLSESQQQICSFFLKGRCKYGEKCKKGHGPISSQATQSKMTIGTMPPTQTSATANHDPMTSTSRGRPDRSQTRACIHWSRGVCWHGDKCKYRHDCEQKAGVNAVDGASVPATERQEGKKRRGRGAVSKKNAIIQGDQDRARQEAEEKQLQDEEERSLRELDEQKRKEAEEIERIRREVEEARRERAEAERRKAEVAAERERVKRLREAERERIRQEAERRAQQLRADEEERREERNRLDEAKTVQHLVLGSTIVKFGAGVNIERIVTGFDSCRVRVSDLPPDAKPNEVCGLLRDQGIEEEAFQLVNLKMWKGKKEANFIVEDERGRALALGVDGIDFRGQTLGVEASDSGTLQGMNSNNSAVLSISWRIPSSRFVVHYYSSSPGDVALKKDTFNGHTLHGRKIRVEGNRLPGRQTFEPYSLLVSGVSTTTSIEDIRDLFEAFSVRKLPSNEYSEDIAEHWLRSHVRALIPGSPVEFEASQFNPAYGNRSMKVQFRTWEVAKKVYDELSGKKFPSIGNSMFRLWLPDPYQITIPIQQYRAQKKQWDAFVDGTKDRKESVLHVRLLDDKAILRVGGDDMKAVGMLKVRVESLVAGETLQDMWHVWFGSSAGQTFLGKVLTDTGAYVRHDWRLRAVKAFGDPAAISRAKTMMMEEMERLSGLEHTEMLKRQSIRFFVERGVATLKEAFGDDNVTLDISSSPVRITIRGGEEARHLLRKLIDESLFNVMTDFSTASESSCPICLTEVSNPVKLGCGHEYCTACLRHFFTADIKNFPIACVGDEATCMKPIALPTIQKFLTQSQFNTLLETAFTTHIERNPQTYRYCNTPDCRQIYGCVSNSSATARTTASRCPSCLATVCTKCHEEAHDGMTCEERRIQADPAEQERLNDAWARDAGVKRCPSCRVWIEKTEGCNHMSCRCGAHICWVCMGTFDAGTIYTHMNAAHGGIYERREGRLAAGNEDVDIGEQVQAFREYEAQRDWRPGVNQYFAQVEALRADAERVRRAHLERQRAEALRAQRDVEAMRQAYRNQMAREEAQQRERLRRGQAEQDRQGGWCVVM